MVIKQFILIFILLLLSPLNSEPLKNSGLLLLEKGIKNWDISSFKESILELKKDPSSRSHYWQAVNLFYQSQYYLYGNENIKDEPRGEVILDSAINHIEKLQADSLSNPELDALLATMYGMNISVNIWSAFSNGSKIFSLMETALASDSTNPRIQYLIGTSYLFTPGVLGGGSEEGRKFLKKAVNLYSLKNDIEIEWGRSTAMGFIAHSWILDEEFSKANTWIEKCLKFKFSDLVCLDAKTKLKEGQE
jgi:hypothetical protein